MLLETFGRRSKDIIVYSLNRFDYDNNFWYIDGSAEVKKPERITYPEVCEIVKFPAAKKIVLYRLKTNVNRLNAFTTKYGYFIKINGVIELVYFDPVFALKDLKHLKFDLNPEQFRFKIQQVGLITKEMKQDEVIFSEVYSTDMRAIEAKYQNDKIFVDALFAFDDNFIDTPISDEKRDGPSPKLPDTTSEKSISEDKTGRGENFSKVGINADLNNTGIREEKIKVLKNALGLGNSDSEAAAQKFRLKAETSVRESTEEREDKKEKKTLFDLFREASSNKKSNYKEEKQSVILKLTDSKE